MAKTQNTTRKLLKDVEVAQVLRLHVQTVRDWRGKRQGPPWIRVGGAVRYEEAELYAWMKSREVRPS